jgi:hypothetical protein
MNSVEFDFDTHLYKYTYARNDRSINIVSKIQNVDLKLTPNRVLKLLIYNLEKDNRKLIDKVNDLEIRLNLVSETLPTDTDYWGGGAVWDCPLCGLKFNTLFESSFECKKCEENHCGICTRKIQYDIGDDRENTYIFGEICMKNSRYCLKCNNDLSNKLTYDNKIYYCIVCNHLHCDCTPSDKCKNCGGHFGNICRNGEQYCSTYCNMI